MLTADTIAEFRVSFAKVQRAVYQLGVEKGFLVEKDDVGTKLALMHSEISEVLEVVRKRDEITKSDKIPAFTMMEEELADLIIRVMDLAAIFDLDIASAVLAKHEYNKTRPYRHGKRF